MQKKMNTMKENLGKNSIFLCIFFLSIQLSVAQNEFNVWPSIDTTDRFNDVNTPYLEVLTFWVQRQNLITNGYQIKINTEIPVNKRFDYHQSNRYFEMFMPLFHYKKFGSNFGVAQNKYVIASDDNNFIKNLQYNYYILIMQYTVGRWKFGLSGEYYYASEALLNNLKTGNEWMPLLTLAYAFNKKWQLMSFWGYNTNFRENDKNTTPIIAMQCKYNPSQRINLVFGAPVIAGLDWNIIGNLNFTGKYFINKDTEAYLSYFASDNLRFSIMYSSNQNRSSKSYFTSEILSLNNQNHNFNNITCYNNTILFETGIKLHSNTNITIACGYKLKSDIELNLNDKEIFNMTSKDDFLLKVGFHYLLYK